MELNNHVLLIISISSLILAFSGEAQDISPSPSESTSSPAPAPVSASYISSTPSHAPASSYISSTPSSAPAAAAASYISSTPSSAPVASYISSAPDSAPASSPSYQDEVDDDDLAGDVDIPVVLEKFIRGGIYGAEVGIKQAQKLLEDPSTPPPVGVCLRQCVENFGYSIDDFKKALGHVADSDDFLLGGDLAAASSDVSACDLCFEELVGGHTNPLAEFNKAVKSTSSQCLSILDFHI